ncbi:MAG: cupin domain-containing protein [Dehalococcoidales bacterium]|nr:cupin domain-containing protein [Dehalococcoidales bacterium]
MEAKLPQRTEKPWGYELLLAMTSYYAGKLIFIEKDQRLSLQYHRKKDESMYIFQGKVALELETDGKLVQSILMPGDCLHIPPKTKHRLKAIEDTTLFEVSTPELDDVVRLADDYGRKIDTL